MSAEIEVSAGMDSTGVASRAVIIDQYLPRYDYVVAHARIFRAAPAAVFGAARRADFYRDPIVRGLMAIRSLPGELKERMGSIASAPARTADASAPTRSLRLDDMVGPQMGWTILGDEPGVEVCMGTVARPWKAAASDDPVVAPAEFATFDRPGFAKIAFNIRVEPYGETSAVLAMETRVALTDQHSRRRFRRYWTVVGPFSHLIRVLVLRQVEAELSRD